ncbi:MAG: type II toxin-antitoxin system RelE/ParE family toxin [Nitrospiraceae bacterium]|nr:type II toxin-antitoxin system RelE/ParE family toxin [Nitrospiraceae bacterium]
MNYRIIPTPSFQRDAKNLKKKYRHIGLDLEKLSALLTDNPVCGDAIPGLEGKIFKVRLASSDTGRGKSSGFRVIYYISNPDTAIYLLSIYAKAYKENIDSSEIKMLMKQIGLWDK